MTSADEQAAGVTGSTVPSATVRCFGLYSVMSAAIILLIASFIVVRVMGVSTLTTLVAAAGLVLLLLFGVELALRSALPAASAGTPGRYSDEATTAAKKRLFAIAGEQILAFALTGFVVSFGVLYFGNRAEKEQQLREDRQRFLAYVEETSVNELGYRRSTRYIGFDFSGMAAADVLIKDANLSGATLDDVNFAGSTFRDSILDEARGKKVIFDGVDAFGLTARGIRLDGASFTRAFLQEGDFEGATLARVDFTGSSLEGVLFQDTEMDDVNFSGVNLSGAKFHDASMSSIVWDNVCWRSDDPPSGSSQLPDKSAGEPDPLGFCPAADEGG